MDDHFVLSSPLLGIRAIVIDLDGTLIDSRKDFVVALNRMMDDLRLPHIDADFVAATIGKGSANLVRKTVESKMFEPVDEQLYQYAYSRYIYHYSDINGCYSTVFPGVLEGLAELQKQGFAMACLTNKPSVLTGPLLVEKGLAGFFQCAFGEDAFIRKKPDPLPLMRVCEALNVDPGYVLMVGDSVNDAMAARNAKCHVALVRYGFNHGHPVDEEDADLYLNSLTDLPKLIRKV